MFVAIVSSKRGKRILKTLSLLVSLSCFTQFSGLVQVAVAAKIERNTLNLKKQLSELPTLKPPKRSPLGEKIIQDKVMRMPTAVKEYVYKIESIEKQLDLLEQKLESGEDINIDYRIVLAKLAGLKSLRKEVQRNFRIRSRRLKDRLAKKDMPVVRNALDALQKQRREFREAAAPVFEKLEAFGIADAIDRVKINRLRRLVKRLKIFKRRLPRSHDNPLPWRSVERKQVTPETESSVTPAYMRSSKNRYAARITRKTAGSKSLAAGVPTPDDLSETPDVVITRQMRDIVERLGHSPARIYEWVKNNIQSEFYCGSLRGSAGTLAKRAGNDTDTSSLLIALLRAAGVPCRYVQGTVEIPMRRAKALTGIGHEPNVGRYFANAGIPVWNTGTGRIRFEHTWVEAWVDYMPYGGAKAGTGDTWVPLSPWYKYYENTPGTDLAGLTGFDRETFIDDYMQTVRTDDPADAYKMYFDSWFRENGPGRNWQEGLGSRSLKPERYRKLPVTVNFEVISFLGEYVALPQEQRHTVTIEVPEAGIAHTMNIMDCIGKKISFAYLPADNETRDLINESGGIEHIHPLSVNLLPALLVDGQRAAMGKTVNAGFEHEMRVTFYVPGFGSDAVTYEMVSGGYYVLGIDPQHVTNKLLSDRLSEACDQAEEPFSSYENMDETPGDGLYVAVMKYFRDRNTADYDIAALSKVRVLKETTCALIGRDPQVIVDRFGLPVSLDKGLLFIDSQRDFATPVSVAGNRTAEKDFLYIRGYNASYNEHDMFEDYVGIEAVSTVKVLQIARQHNMPVYTIDAANSDSIIPILGHDEAVKQVIRNAVHRGRIVTVHKDPVTVKQWRGVGYIERDPVTHAAGYYGIGRKGFASAVLTDIQSEVIWQTGMVGTTCGNPVSMASGNKLQKETDLVLPAAGMDVDITRYYNSRGDWVGLFGHGWTFTCDQKLQERPAEGQVVYRTADGRLYTYTPDADGTYTAEPGNYAVLTKTDEGFVIRKKGGTRYLFNPAGKLMQIVDRNGNSLSFSYRGDDLTGITDAAGRRIDVACRDGKITRITTPEGDNTWTYTYDGDDLVRAVNNAGQTVSYTYRDHNMTSRTGPGGKTVVYEYYSSGKVHCELLPNGAEMVFSYNGPLRIATMRGGCCSVSHHYYNRYGLNTGHMDALGYEELVEYDDQLSDRQKRRCGEKHL